MKDTITINYKGKEKEYEVDKIFNYDSSQHDLFKYLESKY